VFFTSTASAGRVKVKPSTCIAPCIQTTLKRSGMDHTVLPAIVLQTKTGRASPPLPRLGFRANDDDPDKNTSVRKTSRATPLPRIGRRRIVDNVVRRAPLPRLGYRKTPDGKRSLPLPRIGRRAHDHWNLESRTAICHPCLSRWKSKLPYRFVDPLEPGKRLSRIIAAC